MNDKYLSVMGGLWEGEYNHLLERVGARQFSIDVIDSYYRMIFSGIGDGRFPNNVLEYGCGVGRLVIPFARRHPNNFFFGVDISRDMLAAAYANSDDAKNAAFFQTAGDGIDPVRGAQFGPFDYIYSVITLQHICSRLVVGKILRSFADNMSPHGRFMIQVKKFRDGLRPWDYEPDASGVPSVLPDLTWLPAHLHMEEGNSYTSEQIEAVCGSSGLTVDKIMETLPIDDHGEWLCVYGTKSNV